MSSHHGIDSTNSASSHAAGLPWASQMLDKVLGTNTHILLDFIESTEALLGGGVEGQTKR